MSSPPLLCTLSCHSCSLESNSCLGNESSTICCLTHFSLINMNNLHVFLVCFVPLQRLRSPGTLRKQVFYEHRRRCVRQPRHLIILQKVWKSVKPTRLARLGMWTLRISERSISSLWISMNETVSTYCIRMDFLQLRASGRQETNQVTILPSLLLPNWLPEDPKNRISDDASWLTGMGD